MNLALQENYLVEKSNEFNSMYPENITLTELRLLVIYQSKIDARNPNNRKVKFLLSDFAKIMELQRYNVTNLKKISDKLLQRIITVPNENDGYTSFQLFSSFSLEYLQDIGVWCVTLECHSQAMPYMFEMKNRYFKYQLWNTFNLKSVNQIRMYEVLKQYEKIGTRKVSLCELKKLLGIREEQYSDFRNFRRSVLEPCQLALIQYTDICFQYDVLKTSRGKVNKIVFTINKNKEYKNKLKIEEFLNVQTSCELKSDEMEEFQTTCNKDWKDSLENVPEHITEKQLSLLYKYCSVEDISEQDIIKILNSAFIKLEIKAEQTAIANPFGYLTAIVNTEIYSKKNLNNSKNNLVENTTIVTKLSTGSFLYSFNGSSMIINPLLTPEEKEEAFSRYNIKI